MEIGDLIKLDNDKEYIIINKMALHNTEYIFAITNSKPLEIIIGTEKNINGQTVFQEIKDNNELDYVLSNFVSE